MLQDYGSRYGTNLLADLGYKISNYEIPRNYLSTRASPTVPFRSIAPDPGIRITHGNGPLLVAGIVSSALVFIPLPRSITRFLCFTVGINGWVYAVCCPILLK